MIGHAHYRCLTAVFHIIILLHVCVKFSIDYLLASLTNKKSLIMLAERGYIQDFFDRGERVACHEGEGAA